MHGAALMIASAMLIVGAACTSSPSRETERIVADRQPGAGSASATTLESGQAADVPKIARDPGTSPAQKADSSAEGAFCQEHGVLEAVCTKCNPKLIPVFKAKDDWCAEHELPESFCPICHPERGGRPAADVSPDGAPADGTKVRFKTKETAQLAGIETVSAQEGASSPGVQVVARLVYDATRVAQVNARAPGVVRELKVDLGAQVEQSSPLAVIESASVGADRARLRSSSMRVNVATATYEREKRLHEQGISPLKDVLAAGQELEAARAERATAAAALGMVGGTTGSSGSYTLTSPLEGVVTRREVTIGQRVGTEEVLFEVVDTRTLWAELEIPAEVLPQVLTGQRVRLTLEGLGERELRGQIDYIAPALDPHTRTAMARVRLENPDGVLRAHLFGTAYILTGAPHSSVLIPRDAVQRAKGATLVFVRLAEDLFETRRVRLGSAEGERVTVTDGIRPGEEVATTGSFLLKTETLKESIGAGCCEVE